MTHAAYAVASGTPLPGRGADVRVENHGSIFVFVPLTGVAVDWFKEHVQSEPWQWTGGRLGVDHRHAGDLAEGLQFAGLEVR